MVGVANIAWFVLLSLLLIPVAPAGGEVLQWTDSRGVIYFTDNPRAVPEFIRNSSQLIVRSDLTSVEFSEAPVEPVTIEPALEPAPPDSPKAEPPQAPPTIVQINPQTFHIIVVNSFVSPVRRRPPPRGVFRPNFDDRRFIHPSVFDGGSRQFIEPQLFPKPKK